MATAPALPPAPAESLPAWVLEAVKYMRSLDLGQDWMDLVDTWLTLERKLAFGVVTGVKMKLTTQFRPPQVADWMQRHRPYTEAAATITDVDEFGDATMKWWRQIQPLWRQGDDKLPLAIYTPPENESWDVLAQGGPTGLLLLMVVLGWWGSKPNTPSQEWRDVVSDAKKSFESVSHSYVGQGDSALSSRNKRRKKNSTDEGTGK
ncbi:hypothetical protein BDN71DRAFT_1395808 [Pleurotus eryngii]|uniref:Uncharacterized protein n=1 Tax=Pleurotus eryngii TaxID=5323 RepID=A0A9P5ZR59_PLEER|nr:hypothetical protein BDN71DRAFT_1395808 [Pleurotus eryngii]